MLGVGAVHFRFPANGLSIDTYSIYSFTASTHCYFFGALSVRYGQ